MDEPIIGLAGEVPEDGLAPSTVPAACVQSVEHPELLAVRRGVFLEVTVGQPPAEPRLAHPRVAHQHDLGAGVADRRCSRLGKQDVEVQLPDVDEAVARRPSACRDPNRPWRECAEADGRRGRGASVGWPVPGSSRRNCQCRCARGGWCCLHSRLSMRAGGRRRKRRHTSRYPCGLRASGEAGRSWRPRLHRVVITRAGQRAALGSKATAVTVSVCPSSERRSWPELGVPELHRVVTTRAGQRAARGIEGDGGDHVRMPFERAEKLAGVGLPELHRVVNTPAGQRAARGIEGDGSDRVLVPFERAEQLAGVARPRASPCRHHSRWPACGPWDRRQRTRQRPPCPVKVRRHSPVSAFHSRIVLSSDGDASTRPSGDHAIRADHSLHAPAACAAASRPAAAAERHRDRSAHPSPWLLSFCVMAVSNPSHLAVSIIAPEVAMIFPRR